MKQTASIANMNLVSNFNNPKPASIKTYCHSCGGSGDADKYSGVYPNSLDKTNIKNPCPECKGAGDFSYNKVSETPQKYLHLWDN